MRVLLYQLRDLVEHLVYVLDVRSKLGFVFHVTINTSLSQIFLIFTPLIINHKFFRPGLIIVTWGALFFIIKAARWTLLIVKIPNMPEQTLHLDFFLSQSFHKFLGIVTNWPGRLIDEDLTYGRPVLAKFFDSTKEFNVLFIRPLGILAFQHWSIQ